MRLTLTLLAFLFFCQNASAQEVLLLDSTQVVTVRMKDGNEITGKFIRQDANTITIQSESYGELNLQKSQVDRMYASNGGSPGAQGNRNDNIYSTRYLFGPNAYNLKKGEGYYQNTWIFINQASVGVTDHFTIGGGMIPLFLFAGTPTPVWITPKFNLPTNSNTFNAGVGVLAGTVIGEDIGGFGILYGNTTFGPRDRNVNLSLGYGFADGEWASAPTVSISGIYRTGPKFALITENYFLDAGDSNYLLMSFGTRFYFRDLALDGALIIPTETGGEIFAIPWLGVTVPFGNR